MADFSIAVAITLKHEGGFSDSPNDPGGATNMGVEQRDMPDIPIRDLTVSQATNYYQETYWKPFYSLISSQSIASKLFDMGVLFGVGTAVKNLQAALNVEMDGLFGPGTLHAVNAARPTSLLLNFQMEMNAHVRAIVAANPKLGVFQVGWQNRINS